MAPANPDADEVPNRERYQPKMDEPTTIKSAVTMPPISARCHLTSA